MQKEFDLSITVRMKNKLAEHLLKNKALTPGALTRATLAVKQSQHHHTQSKNSGHLNGEEHAKMLNDDNPST